MQQIETIKSRIGAISTITAARLLKKAFAALMMSALLISGCGPSHQQAINSDEYVEVDNPFVGDSPDASPKVWVQRKSLERGLPRGGELAKRGYEKVIGKPVDSAVIVDAGKPPDGVVRNRLLVAEAGEQTVGVPLRKFLSRGSIARSIARPSANELANEQEQLATIATVAAQPSGGPILFISKPEGVKPGARIKADLYDIRGPLLIRSFWATVPQPKQGQSAEDALLSTLKGLADTALSSLEWFPWYGRVVSVSGDRIYFDGGAESGLKAGQRISIYRGGEVVKGIGFAPGARIASLTISELFGADGAFAISLESAKIQPGDYVELDKP